jgi:hypothetical protein
VAASDAVSGSTYSQDRFTAGQIDVTIAPRLKYVRPPLLAHHSAANSPAEFVGTSTPSLERIAAMLGDEGYSIVAPSGVATWGNGTAADEAATAMGRSKDALAWARAAPPNGFGQSSAPPVALGASEGSLWSIKYAARHPVACVVCFLTICDLSSVYTANLGGFRSQIEAAYGVTYPAALPAGADPYRDHLAALSSVPLLCQYSSDDAYSTHIAEFAAATGATLINSGALGHSDASIAQADINQIRAFVRAHT